jgi:hypothetical protein
MNNSRVRNGTKLQQDIKSLINNDIIYCHNQVSKEYLRDSILDMADILCITYNKFDVPTGFATVIKNYISKNSRYIHLICVQSYSHMKMRSNKNIQNNKPKGSDLLHKIKEDAIEDHCDVIELQALEHVITYYYKQGYRFVTHCSRDEDFAIKDIITELYKSRNNMNKINTLLRSKYLTRFLPGRLAENNLRETINTNKLNTLIDNGYLMRLCLK